MTHKEFMKIIDIKFQQFVDFQICKCFCVTQNYSYNNDDKREKREGDA